MEPASNQNDKLEEIEKEDSPLPTDDDQRSDEELGLSYESTSTKDEETQRLREENTLTVVFLPSYLFCNIFCSPAEKIEREFSKKRKRQCKIERRHEKNARNTSNSETYE